MYDINQWFTFNSMLVAVLGPFQGIPQAMKTLKNTNVIIWHKMKVENTNPGQLSASFEWRRFCTKIINI